MATILVGVSGPEFGVEDESWGFIQNLSQSFEMNEEELIDGDGDIVAAAYHGKKGEVTFDFVIKTEADIPDHTAIGGLLTLIAADFSIYVRQVTKTHSNQGFLTGSGVGSVFPEFSGVTTTTT